MALVVGLAGWLGLEGWVVSPSKIVQVKTEELSGWLKKGEKVWVLDTRSARFDDMKRLPGAMSLPYNTPEGGIREKIPDFESKVVVYCGHEKCPASQYMAERLVRLGYQKVYRYGGGVKAWSKEGKPIELAKSL